MTSPSRPSRRTLSPWQKFLAGKTTWQRFIIQLSALAGAIITISGATFGGWKAINAVIDRGTSTATGTTDTEPAAGAPIFRRADPLKSETADVDELVALLTLAARAYAAEPNSPDSRVTLDFHVDAEPQDSGSIKLNYGCPNQPPCEAALQAWEPTIFEVNQGATLFEGVYVVRIQQGQPERNIEFGLHKVAELAG